MDSEAQAREKIDAALVKSACIVQGCAAISLPAAQAVAVWQFSLALGQGHADYLLFLDQQAIGVLEAKKEGRR